MKYGSFEVQSSAMISLLESITQNRDKKYFVIVGEPGTGKTTMLQHVNNVVFSNAQHNLFDGTTPDFSVDSAIICTGKEQAFDIIRKFDSRQTLVLAMPSLIERKTDLIPAAHFFIEVLGLMNNKGPFKLTDKATEKLLQYGWPGHFHEFEAVLEQAFETAAAQDTKGLIGPELVQMNKTDKELEFTIGQKLDEVERKYILQTLYFVHQNRTRAAEILGISIRTLRNKINLYREEGYL
jgi:DNA-binding NtrC family response regulator